MNDEEADSDVDLPVECMEVDSENVASVSGIIFSMFSSSLATSNMDGRRSVLSWQQLRAKATNLSKHSDGQGPILLSMMESIKPDSQAAFTWI